jgi:hypothetical protein
MEALLTQGFLVLGDCVKVQCRGVKHPGIFYSIKYR